MANLSPQAPVSAAILDKMNTLRAIVHRNTLAAAYKNYMGRHNQETHTTLFNLANPSSGERRVSGAGDVRAKDAGGEAGGLKRGQEGYPGYLARAKITTAGEQKDALKRYEEYRDRVAFEAHGVNYASLQASNPQGAQEVSDEAATSFHASLIEEKAADKKNSAWREIYEKRREGEEQKIAQLRQDAGSPNPIIALRATRELAKQERRIANFDALEKREGVTAARQEVRRLAHEVVVINRQLIKEQASVFGGGKKADLRSNNDNADREDTTQSTADRGGPRNVREAGARVDAEELGVGGGMGLRGGIRDLGGSRTTVDKLKGQLTEAKTRLQDAQANRTAAEKRVERIIGLRSEGYFPKGTGAGKDYVPGPSGRGTGRIARFQRPDLFDYEQTIPAGQARLAFMRANKPNDPEGKSTGWNKGSDNYWNKYTAPLNAVVAKSPEAAGLNFLKNYFRNLSGMDGASNVPMSNLRPEQSTYGKSSRSAGAGKMVTQEKLTELYRLINRGIADATRATDPKKEASGDFSSRPGNKKGGGRVTREEVRDFIVNQLGIDAKIVDAYKELSDFQFSYKMLREISCTLDAIATYKSRQHNKNVLDVVKQNMARYFQF